ncbi:MAG: hypothetical protein HC830_10490 [Bacteroidetes bacterium]|nr:hypothetical protein [Bacteroidota bacterium]
MKKTIFLSVCLLTIICFTSCKKKGVYWKVTDLTPENVFTSGIEGPACIPSGPLFVVNFKNNGTIGIVDSLGRTELYATLPNGSIGNGIRFDKNWNMFIADYVNHNILVMRSGERTISVFAHDSTHEPTQRPGHNHIGNYFCQRSRLEKWYGKYLPYHANR